MNLAKPADRQAASEYPEGGSENEFCNCSSITCAGTDTVSGHKIYI